MDADKKNNVVAVKSSGIVVGSGKNTRIYFRTAGLVAAILIVLAGMAFATYMLVHHFHNQKSNSTSTSTTASKFKLDTKQSVGDQAFGLELTGRYADAQKLLTDQIAKTSDKTKQGDYYAEKAGFAFNHKDYTNALNFAEKADVLHGTASSADWAGQSAETLGQKATAVKYYKLEVTRLGKPFTPSDRNTITALQAKITSLGG
jgi:hypothetical protein